MDRSPFLGRLSAPTAPEVDADNARPTSAPFSRATSSALSQRDDPLPTPALETPGRQILLGDHRYARSHQGGGGEAAAGPQR